MAITKKQTRGYKNVAVWQAVEGGYLWENWTDNSRPFERSVVARIICMTMEVRIHARKVKEALLNSGLMELIASRHLTEDLMDQERERIRIAEGAIRAYEIAMSRIAEDEAENSRMYATAVFERYKLEDYCKRRKYR